MATATAPARAVGTGGIELTPIPARTPDGKPVKSFRVHLAGGEKKQQQFLLRNVITTPATADVYAASATRSPDGRFAVGGAGSAKWIELDRLTVTLEPNEQRVVSFDVRRKGAPDLPTTYGAVVVEVARGAVVERAATIVSLTRSGRDRDILPLVAGASALLLLAVALYALGRARAHRRADKTAEATA